MTMDGSRLFGKGMSFPPRVGADGHVTWSAGDDNVRESIRVILMTEPRERLRLPEFGAGLARFLFEPNTPATRLLIQERITLALARWEPRVRVESVTVEPHPAEPQTALATIVYRMVANQQRERLSLSVALAGSQE
jgi:hypothetical protein